jgi:hypothetical protein
MQRLPTVDEVRPGRCPCCGTASRRPGQRLSLWGHGLRERLVQGPPVPDGEPTDMVIAARRYVCLGCDAVLLVVPRGIVAWRHYTAAAIAWALALFGEGRPVAEVRRRTSTTRQPAGFGEARRWASLRRWAKAVLARALFGRAPIRPPAGATLRQIAALIARTLAAHALPSVRQRPIAEQAYLGGVAMA